MIYQSTYKKNGSFNQKKIDLQVTLKRLPEDELKKLTPEQKEEARNWLKLTCETFEAYRGVIENCLK